MNLKRKLSERVFLITEALRGLPPEEAIGLLEMVKNHFTKPQKPELYQVDIRSKSLFGAPPSKNAG